MRVAALTVFCLVLAFSMVTTLATHVLINNWVEPDTALATMALGTVASSVISMGVDLDVLG